MSQRAALYLLANDIKLSLTDVALFEKVSSAELRASSPVTPASGTGGYSEYFKNINNSHTSNACLTSERSKRKVHPKGTPTLSAK